MVQTDLLNDKAAYPITILVPCSSQGSERVPSHAEVQPSEENGLDNVSYVKCEQIQALPKDRLLRRRGRLSDADVAKLGARLKNALGLSEGRGA